MKKSHVWFMIEGLLCGFVEILVWEFAVSPWFAAHAWLRPIVPTLGILLSAVSFFFLMRRFPATKKKKKFLLSLICWVVIIPAWIVYGRVFGLKIFPHRAMVAAEYSALLGGLVVWYAVGLAVTRLGIIIYYYILKKRKKKAQE